MSLQTFYHLQAIEAELKQKYFWFDIDFLETKCFLSYLAFMAVLGRHCKLYSSIDLLEVKKYYKKEFYREKKE